MIALRCALKWKGKKRDHQRNINAFWQSEVRILKAFRSSTWQRTLQQMNNTHA